MKLRARLGALLALLILAAGASSAQASLSTSRIGDTLVVASSFSSEVNDVSMTLDDGLHFNDLSAGESGGYCPVVSGDIVCGVQLIGIEDIRVELIDGDDSLSSSDYETLSLPPTQVLTGPGNDSLSMVGPVAADLGPGNDSANLGLFRDSVSGGGGKDVIFAGAGDDTIKGGGGNDRLSGGFEEIDPSAAGRSDGRDSFIAGTGKDKILARDSTKDKRIDCGGGNDKPAQRDSFDPKPKSC